MVEILLLLLQQLLLLNSNHNHGGDDRDSEERCAKLQTKKVQLMKFAKAAAQKVKKKTIRAFYIKLFLPAEVAKIFKEQTIFPILDFRRVFLILKYLDMQTIADFRGKLLYLCEYVLSGYQYILYLCSGH